MLLRRKKDVEEHSKTKYVPPHRRQPTQKFVPICHHYGLTGHIQPKCPHVLVQRSKVKELQNKDSTSTKPPRKHQAQKKLSRYALPVHKTLICHQCGVNSHVRPRSP